MTIALLVANFNISRIPGDSSFLLLSFAEVALIALGADSPLASACPRPPGNAPSTGFSLSSFYPMGNNRKGVEFVNLAARNIHHGLTCSRHHAELLSCRVQYWSY